MTELRQILLKSQDLKVDEGVDLSFIDSEILAEYEKLPLPQLHLPNLNIPANSESVVVFGGETHGISQMARKLAIDNQGSSIYVPLKNRMESLNVASAASIILYQFMLKYTTSST